MDQPDRQPQRKGLVHSTIHWAVCSPVPAKRETRSVHVRERNAIGIPGILIRFLTIIDRMTTVPCMPLHAGYSGKFLELAHHEVDDELIDCTRKAHGENDGHI